MSDEVEEPFSVRGIEIPNDHHYNGVQSWEWTEIGDDGKMRSFELTFTVAAVPLEEVEEDLDDEEQDA